MAGDRQEQRAAAGQQCRSRIFPVSPAASGRCAARRRGDREPQHPRADHPGVAAPGRPRRALCRRPARHHPPAVFRRLLRALQAGCPGRHHPGAGRRHPDGPPSLCARARRHPAGHWRPVSPVREPGAQRYRPGARHARWPGAPLCLPAPGGLSAGGPGRYLPARHPRRLAPGHAEIGDGGRPDHPRHAGLRLSATPRDPRRGAQRGSPAPGPRRAAPADPQGQPHRAGQSPPVRQPAAGGAGARSAMASRSAC